jgi:hypothetical protein
MLGNLADLAATGLASEPTLRKWLRELPDCDWLKKRGSNGDAYEIDIPAAIAAWKSKEAEKAEIDRQKSEDLRQMGLDFGLQMPAQDVGLSIADRKQLIDEEVSAMKLGRLRKELVPVASVEAIIGDILLRDAQRRGTFGARLAKKIDLNRQQLMVIEELIATDQAWFVEQMENWGKDIVDDSDDILALEPSAAAMETAAPDDGS